MSSEMNLSSKHHHSHAGASITKAAVSCCASMRQVAQKWTKQQTTGPGFEA